MNATLFKLRGQTPADDRWLLVEKIMLEDSSTKSVFKIKCLIKFCDTILPIFCIIGRYHTLKKETFHLLRVIQIRFPPLNDIVL